MPAIRTTRTSLHYGTPPQLETTGAQHWISRGTNFVVVTTKARAGATIERAGNPDESIVLLPIGAAATVSAGGASISSPGDAVFIVPPGSSSVRVEADCTFYRVFSHRADDLAQAADNAAEFAQRDERVAKPVPWPEPPAGFKLRHYELAKYARSDTPMRLFRCTNLMVNVFPRRNEPRDPKKLSPHSHTDIEQGSLAISGNYVHHMRYPWGGDMTVWHDDEHDEVGSPSLCIIPPTVIHTSQSVGTEPSQLVDVFSPPRADFSLRPGLVCNADEYPIPPDVAAMTDVKGE
jgi:hypothetical protein